MSSRPNSMAERRSSGTSNGGRKSVSKPASGSGSTRPPSGKNRNKTQELLSKEEEYMRLNAELEDRTASLLKEAEAVMLDQDEILSKPSAVDINYTEDLDDDFLPMVDMTSSKPVSATTKQKSRSSSATSQGPRNNSAASQGRPSSRTKKARPKSKTGVAPRSNTQTPLDDMTHVDALQDRISLADAISALEEDAKDDSYTVTLNDDVLPPGAEDMGSGTL